MNKNNWQIADSGPFPPFIQNTDILVLNPYPQISLVLATDEPNYEVAYVFDFVDLFLRTFSPHPS